MAETIQVCYQSPSVLDPSVTDGHGPRYTELTTRIKTSMLSSPVSQMLYSPKSALMALLCKQQLCSRTSRLNRMQSPVKIGMSFKTGSRQIGRGCGRSLLCLMVRSFQ